MGLKEHSPVYGFANLSMVTEPVDQYETHVCSSSFPFPLPLHWSFKKEEEGQSSFPDDSTKID